MYKIKHRERNSKETLLSYQYRHKSWADDHIHRIGEAQRELGATHVTQAPGLSRASWPDGTYTETWRVYEED